DPRARPRAGHHAGNRPLPGRLAALPEARRASRDRLRRVSALLAGPEAGGGTRPAPHRLEPHSDRYQPCHTKNAVLYRRVRENYAAVIKHHEIRVYPPYPAGPGGRARHDSRPRRSRCREKAPADVPELRGPGTQRHATRGDATAHGAGRPGRNELRRDRFPDQQVAVAPGADEASRNPEDSNSSSRPE